MAPSTLGLFPKSTELKYSRLTVESARAVVMQLMEGSLRIRLTSSLILAGLEKRRASSRVQST